MVLFTIPLTTFRKMLVLQLEDKLFGYDSSRLYPLGERRENVSLPQMIKINRSIWETKSKGPMKKKIFVN